MPEVHPTAIVSSEAELAEGVVIGPWCTVSGKVRIGPGTKLIAQVHLQGPLEIGRSNTLYPGACVGFAPQDHSFDPDEDGAGTVVGDDNVLREGVTIHRATAAHPTTLGSHNYLMAGSHMAHDVRVGSHCTMANGTLLAGHVEVADQVTMGGAGGVQQYCRVGRLAMVGGVLKLVQDMPPFCLARYTAEVAGLNIVGLRRAGYRDHIRPLRRAMNILYHGQHTNAEAADRINRELGDDPLCSEFAEFIRTTTRGISGLAQA
ncbi:MAG: acyl-ACP--UDP-N-acetylglucosamine O-acyltransferase [Phycisphaeraceae bacterium]